MDELNRKIIGLLTKNARITNTEIAKGLGLSESAVRYRIKNLEKEYIRGYTAVLRDDNKIRCLVSIKVEPQINATEFYPRLKQLSEINELFETSGEFDAVLICSFQAIDEMNSFIDELRAKKRDKGNRHYYGPQKW